MLMYIECIIIGSKKQRRCVPLGEVGTKYQLINKCVVWLWNESNPQRDRESAIAREKLVC